MSAVYGRPQIAGWLSEAAMLRRRKPHLLPLSFFHKLTHV